MDWFDMLFTGLLAGTVGAIGLSVLASVINVFSLVRWHRPSQFGLRLRVAMGGLAMMLASSLVIVLVVGSAELSSVGLWVIAAIAFGVGAWILAGGSQLRVSAAAQQNAVTPAASPAAWLLALWMVPVSALAIWGATGLPSRSGLVAICAASTLALLALYLFSRTAGSAHRLRFGALIGSRLFLALVIVSLLNTFFVLTLDLAE